MICLNFYFFIVVMCDFFLFFCCFFLFKKIQIAGKIVAARTIINKGCESCATNEDVWIEASRLHTPENAKIILARAVQHIPSSVKIWLRAAELEGDSVAAKKRVLRKGLEVLPNSTQLWKAAVDLEGPAEAKIMLRLVIRTTNVNFISHYHFCCCCCC
jgi:hypothetical protein